jgi:hypothetical protein
VSSAGSRIGPGQGRLKELSRSEHDVRIATSPAKKPREWVLERCAEGWLGGWSHCNWGREMRSGHFLLLARVDITRRWVCITDANIVWATAVSIVGSNSVIRSFWAVIFV